MKITRLLFITLVLLISLAGVEAQEAAKAHSVLSVTDARILVYLSPAAKAVRRAGFDVYMEQAKSEAYNQSDYYVFQMFDTRPCEACSANVGFFAVNKRSADVRDLDASERYPLVSSAELKGVQSLLRDAHGITSEMVKRYRNLPILAEERP